MKKWDKEGNHQQVDIAFIAHDGNVSDCIQPHRGQGPQPPGDDNLTLPKDMKK